MSTSRIFKTIGVATIVNVLWMGSLRAQSIDLQVSTTQADINTPLTATITVEGVGGGDVTIAGIEEFEVINQSRSQSVQIINGRQSTQTQLTLSLQPQSAGTYTLGPAIVTTSAGEATSESYIIDVSGEALFGSQSQIFDEGAEDTASTGGGYWWILGVVGVLLLGLIAKVVQAFRVRQSSYTAPDYIQPLSYPTKSAYESTRLDTNPVYDALIDHARGGSAQNLSLAALARETTDGALQGLLRRVEKQLYTDQPDSMLESDIQDYLSSLPAT